MLGVDDNRGAADAAVLFIDRGNFDHAAPQVACQQADTTFLREGAVAASYHTGVETLDRRLLPVNRVVFQLRFAYEVRKGHAQAGAGVRMEAARGQ